MPNHSSLTPPPHYELRVPGAPRTRTRYGRLSKLHDGDDDDDMSIASTQSAPATSSSPPRFGVTLKGSPLAANALMQLSGNMAVDDDETSSSQAEKQSMDNQPAELQSTFDKSTEQPGLEPSVQEPTNQQIQLVDDQERMNFHKQCLRYLQWHAPASAGLFVGNLPNQMTDRQLNDWLCAYFNGFGPCAVEVQRKISMHNGVSMAKPHAIIQFAADGFAFAALNIQHEFLGRVARVQKLNANRSV